MERLVSAARLAMHWPGLRTKKTVSPAMKTGFEVSPAGGRKKRMGLGDFYRIALLRGDGPYRALLPQAGLTPS